MHVCRFVREQDAGKAAELTEGTVKFPIAQQRHFQVGKTALRARDCLAYSRLLMLIG